MLLRLQEGGSPQKPGSAELKALPADTSFQGEAPGAARGTRLLGRRQALAPPLPRKSLPIGPSRPRTPLPPWARGVGSGARTLCVPGARDCTWRGPKARS